MAVGRVLVAAWRVKLRSVGFGMDRLGFESSSRK